MKENANAKKNKNSRKNGGYFENEVHKKISYVLNLSFFCYPFDSIESDANSPIKKKILPPNNITATKLPMIGAKYVV